MVKILLGQQSRRDFFKTTLLGCALIMVPQNELLQKFTGVREKFKLMEHEGIPQMVAWCDPDVKKLIRVIASFHKLPYFGNNEETIFSNILLWVGAKGPLVPEVLDLIQKKTEEILKN